MAIYATQPESTFTPCPEGLHHAVAIDVLDLGMVKSQFGDQYKIRLVWQVEEVNEATDRRYQVAKQYTLSLHEKATLRKDLESWRSKKFTVSELASPGFDLETLIGANCQVHIVHSLKDDGRVFANVSAIVPPPKNVPKLIPTDYVRVKDRKGSSNGIGQPVVTKAEHDRIPF